jgi:hypothetical protein
LPDPRKPVRTVTGMRLDSAMSKPEKTGLSPKRDVLRRHYPTRRQSASSPAPGSAEPAGRDRAGRRCYHASSSEPGPRDGHPGAAVQPGSWQKSPIGALPRSRRPPSSPAASGDEHHLRGHRGARRETGSSLSLAIILGVVSLRACETARCCFFNQSRLRSATAQTRLPRKLLQTDRRHVK